MFILLISTSHCFSSNTSLGFRLEFMGGPSFSVVMDNRLNNNIAINISVGGFPAIILRLEANVRLASTKRNIVYYSGGIGYNHFYRGQADGKGLTEFHAGAGYRWVRKQNAFFALDGGLIYIPIGINKWMCDMSKERKGYSKMPPFVPYVGVETMFHLK
jgi:hypothetical protein